MKTHIYERLGQILNGEDQKADFAKLTPESRRAILEILTDTKPDFAKDAKVAN
jgi:hypothetical protein